jgi:hypothetical protein
MDTVHSGGEVRDNDIYKYLLGVRLSIKGEDYPKAYHDATAKRLSPLIDSLIKSQEAV